MGRVSNMGGHNQMHVCQELEYKQKIGSIVTIQARDYFYLL